jgi:hypothetical protein
MKNEPGEGGDLGSKPRKAFNAVDAATIYPASWPHPHISVHRATRHITPPVTRVMAATPPVTRVTSRYA